jgi:hypothetical protein
MASSNVGAAGIGMNGSLITDGGGGQTRRKNQYRIPAGHSMPAL